MTRSRQESGVREIRLRRSMRRGLETGSGEYRASPRPYVHEPLKTGEWQDARETIGPQRGGVVGNMELRTGKYLGAAAVPQAFDKRYFTLQVMAPYFFLSEFTDLVTRFAEYFN